MAALDFQKLFKATPRKNPFRAALCPWGTTPLNLVLALALGLLVGVERCWQEREAAEGSRLAGIRTFGLIYWTYRATKERASTNCQTLPDIV